MRALAWFLLLDHSPHMHRTLVSWLPAPRHHPHRGRARPIGDFRGEHSGHLAPIPTSREASTMRSLRPRSLVTAALSTAFLTMAAAMAAAQGTITGTVTAQGTNEALQDARVIVLGTSRFAVTAPDGKFRIPNVPAGTADIPVIRVGDTEQKKSVRVIDGPTATLDFSMPQSVVQLQEVVTTATGEQRRVEVGNAVENISVSKLAETAPIKNFADVLNARVPGVMVQSGSQTGSGSRIRVRGVASINLSNDPIYVIDGIRLSSNNRSEERRVGKECRY